MSFDPATALMDLGRTAIEKIWPDPTKRARELRKLEELRQKGDLAELNASVQIMLAQIKVNEESAKHPSIIVAGPRPFMIWVGGFSMAFAGIIHPMLVWVWMFCGIDGEPPPPIDSPALSAILGGLLGIAGMRSYDKKQGTQTDHIK